MDNSKRAAAVFDKNAQVYQEKFMDVALYADSLDKFCDGIPTPNACILDIACGPGNVAQYLLSKRPDFKITGIDLSANMVALASINNANAEFKVMDCRDINKLNAICNGVVCAFCLNYLASAEVVKLVEDIAVLLAAEGILYISLMQGDAIDSGYKKTSSGDELYVTFHSEEFLSALFNKSGFEVLGLQYLSVPGGEPGATDMLVMVRKKLSNAKRAYYSQLF